jgi:hypothetical protein
MSMSITHKFLWKFQLFSGKLLALHLEPIQDLAANYAQMMVHNSAHLVRKLSDRAGKQGEVEGRMGGNRRPE